MDLQLQTSHNGQCLSLAFIKTMSIAMLMLYCYITPLSMVVSVLRHGSKALTLEAVVLTFPLSSYTNMYLIFFNHSGDECKPRGLRAVVALAKAILVVRA